MEEEDVDYYSIKGLSVFTGDVESIDEGVYIPKKAYDDGIRVFTDAYSNTLFSGNMISNSSASKYPYKVKEGMGILQYFERGLTRQQEKLLNKLPRAD